MPLVERIEVRERESEREGEVVMVKRVVGIVFEGRRVPVIAVASGSVAVVPGAPGVSSRSTKDWPMAWGERSPKMGVSGFLC